MLLLMEKRRARGHLIISRCAIGGGFLHTFISKNSTAFPTSIGAASSKKKIILSKQKIVDLLLSGKFILEAQWAATLALGVLIM